jgi:serine/threonine protein kinase
MRGPEPSETPTISVAPSQPGNVIAGRFRVERKIAEGGMGVVVAAMHIQLHQMVALKFLRADIGTQGDVLARFMREARAAAQLKSEHVARVLDLGITEDGTPYMAMEYLEGKSLAETLRAYGPLDIATVAEYGIQTCEGLAEAHSRGIVHRDIKPENLFLVERSPGYGAVKILDFGISKSVLSDVPNLATSVIMGSPCYMSPEQLRSTASVDHTADIWSLGATLHELLSGSTPFDASQTLHELVTAVLEKPAPSLHDLRPAVPVELAAVIAKCLAKNKEDRYENVAQLASALLPFAPVRARAPAERAVAMAATPLPKPKFDLIEGGSQPTGSGLNDAHVGLSGHTSNSQVVTLRAELVPGLGSIAPSAAYVSPQGPAKHTPRGSAIALGTAVVLLAAALVVWAAKGSGSVQAPKATAQAANATSAPSAAPSSSVAPTAQPADQVGLEVRVWPGSAQITIDGDPVTGNPFRGSYPKDGAVHEIRAAASGYRTKTKEVSLSSEVVLDMSLERIENWAGFPTQVAMAPRSVPAGALPLVANTASLNAARADTPALPAPVAVSPAGGRAPLRPIETANPYENH